jgi:hypothetical protein
MEKKKPCEHLNVETKNFSGIPMAVCKDCGKSVNPEEFDKTASTRNAPIPAPPAGPGDRSTEGLDRVFDTLVSDLVSVPGLEKPFFPLFNVKKGDLIIVLREAKKKADQA